jgi:hypothetical protein
VQYGAALGSDVNSAVKTVPPAHQPAALEHAPVELVRLVVGAVLPELTQNARARALLRRGRLVDGEAHEVDRPPAPQKVCGHKRGHERGERDECEARRRERQGVERELGRARGGGEAR